MSFIILFMKTLVKSFKTIECMRHLIFILLALGLSSQICAQDINYENITYQIVCISNKDLKNIGIRHAPYYGAPVTSSYSPELKTLTVWFHYNMEDAEIIITKNGEEVSDNVFCMNANDAVEYDLSECGEGEYAVYVQINGELQMTNIFLKGN